MAHRIKISVSKAGQAKVSVEGVAGETCKDVSRAIENALGKTISDEHTAEYQESPEIAQAVNSNAY